MTDENKQEKDEKAESCGHNGKHHHHHRKHWGGPQWSGPLWVIGWLFTIGFLHLPFFWKGVLAIIIWPVYLGQALK